MRRKISIGLFSMVFLGAGASGYASDNSVDLIVKYKPAMKGVLAVKPSGQLESGKLTVLSQQSIDHSSALVKVRLNDGNAKKDAFNQRAYKAARAYMDAHPEVKYALPKSSKMYAFNMPEPTVSYSASNKGKNVHYWDYQWSMHNTEFGVGAPQAWQMLKNYKTAKTYVGVLDTGLAARSPYDIAKKVKTKGSYYFKLDEATDQIVAVADVTDYGYGRSHGTHVAGTVAANGPNVTGVAGPIKSVKVIPVRVLGDDGSGTTVAILKAMQWAAGYKLLDVKLTDGGEVKKNQHKVSVINLSLGLGRIDNYGREIVDEATWRRDYMVPLCAAWQDTIDMTTQAGVTVVMAAGNESHPLWNALPAGCPNIDGVVVESTGPTGELSYFSNYYDKTEPMRSLTVKSPGGDKQVDYDTGGILSTLGNGYGYMQGTSMATPHMAGIISLIYAMNKDSDYAYVKSVLKRAQKQRVIINSYDVVKTVLQDQSE